MELCSLFVGGTEGIPAQSRLVESVIRRIRENPVCGQCPIVIACEGAPGYSASVIYSQLRDSRVREPRVFDKVTFLCRVRHKGAVGPSPGITKTKQTAIEYKQEMTNLICSENLVLSEDLRIYIADGEVEPVNQVDIGLSRLETMLYDYKFKETVAGGMTVTSKGKENNDMFSALETNVYYMRQFLESPDYAEERDHVFGKK